MPTFTTNYNLAKPLVNSAVDQDLWGTELNSDLDILDTTLKSLQDQITALSISTQLPIGSLYWNKTNATNPATLLGYGTWVAVTDKFIVARGSTYTGTGGAATVTLSSANLPSTTLTVRTGGTVSGPATGIVMNATAGSENGTANTSSFGSGSAFSIIPTYQAAYCWERTA